MKQFIILHIGFEQPTPEQMGDWMKWFETIADRQTTRGGFRGGYEITPDGIQDLPFGKDSITGYTMINAKDMEEALDLAGKCPIVKSTQVYEIAGE